MLPISFLQLMDSQLVEHGPVIILRHIENSTFANASNLAPNMKNALEGLIVHSYSISKLFFAAPPFPQKPTFPLANELPTLFLSLFTDVKVE